MSRCRADRESGARAAAAAAASSDRDAYPPQPFLSSFIEHYTHIIIFEKPSRASFAAIADPCIYCRASERDEESRSSSSSDLD